METRRSGDDGLPLDHRRKHVGRGVRLVDDVLKVLDHLGHHRRDDLPACKLLQDLREDLLDVDGLLLLALHVLLGDAGGGFDELRELVHQRSVELLSRKLDDLLQGGHVVDTLAREPGGCQPVEAVEKRDQSRPQRDVLAFLPVRVSAAVPGLVVVADDRQGLADHTEVG